ncbi:MAG: acyl-CoA dehydrogenase [Gammaproteobacteria bacterium]|nr:MAG: acyl-CoA dehydrogenase [Gammaproteobacteria bacterium]RLA51049.1 MAG: acyl-CoA dehydrogenase [Gammaproteobacteria bacterium]
MALVLNEEQGMLKESAKGFLQENAPVGALRTLRDERDEEGFSRDLWRQMAAMGWAGILIDEAHGGLAFGHVGMGQVMEENGRTLTASPLLSTAILGVSAISIAGSADQKSELLPVIAEGKLLMTLAVDGGSRHNPLNVGVTATASGSGFSLSGEKQFVIDGHVADKIIVSARTSGSEGDSDGITLFVVDADAQGVEIDRIIMADSINSSMVRFVDVAVGADSVLGEPGKGAAVLQQVLDIGNAHLSAELVGLSLEVLERTVAYMNERKQYGVLIGSYQGLQHRAAHLFSEIELAKSVVIKVLQALDEGDDDVSMLASLAKAKVSEVATLATNEGVQLHGGIGMTDELEIGFFMKRARVAEQLLGDQRFHISRFAALNGY